MASAGTTSFLPTLESPHEREGAAARLQAILIGLVDSWRELADTVAERDLASQDVLIEGVRELEKQQWMLRGQIEERA